jgi:hypothetical protein
MKSIPKAIGIVGCTLGVLVALAAVLYFTGWLTWRWEASRTPLPADACTYVGKSEIRAIVPGARFESSSNSSESGESMTCLARTQGSAADGYASVRIEIDRSTPASGMASAAERARSSADYDCQRLRKTITDPKALTRPAEPSDQSCGYAWQNGRETTAQLIAAQSVDTVSIVYQARDSDPSTAGATVVGLADDVLGELATTSGG